MTYFQSIKLRISSEMLTTENRVTLHFDMTKFVIWYVVCVVDMVKKRKDTDQFFAAKLGHLNDERNLWNGHFSCVCAHFPCEPMQTSSVDIDTEPFLPLGTVVLSIIQGEPTLGVCVHFPKQQQEGLLSSQPSHAAKCPWGQHREIQLVYSNFN